MKNVLDSCRNPAYFFYNSSFMLIFIIFKTYVNINISRYTRYRTSACVLPHSIFIWIVRSCSLISCEPLVVRFKTVKFNIVHKVQEITIYERCVAGSLYGITEGYNNISKLTCTKLFLTEGIIFYSLYINSYRVCNVVRS